MRKISEAQLKKTIIAAETERWKNDVRFAPEGAKLQKANYALDRILSPWVKNSGLDLEKVQALNEQRDAELERLVARHKADAGRRASLLKDELHPEIAGQSKALLELVRKPDFFPHPTFTLDKPFLIWSTPLMDLIDSVKPLRSSAKFSFSTSASRGTQKVSFYFFWPSPFSEAAVINASTFLFSSGHLQAHAPWTKNPFAVKSSEIKASARFGLWFGVQNDLTATDYVTEELSTAAAISSTLAGSGTSARTVFAGSSLSKTLFVVPPGKVVVFEVALFLEFENDDGDCQADFQSFDFRIECPAVVFSVVSQPAASIMPD